MTYLAKCDIYIHRADLVSGQPGSIDCCPVAIAIRPHFPGHQITVGVFGARLVRLEANWTRAQYTFPPEVHSFMLAFDQASEEERATMRPFEFVMTLSESSYSR